MSRWLEPITKLERCRSYIIGSETGEIVAEYSRKRNGIVLDDCALAYYGYGALCAALRKSGFMDAVLA